jgi:hypothetical protein
MVIGSLFRASYVRTIGIVPFEHKSAGVTCLHVI